MPKETQLDELVEFPNIVIRQVFKEQVILDLLADKKNASIEDMVSEDGSWRYAFDYEHIPQAPQEVCACICIDTDVVSVPNKTTKRLDLYVSVFCFQDFLKPDKELFIGLCGNRMNNLIRYIDRALRSSREFGVGQLEMKEVRTVPSGSTNYIKKQLPTQFPALI